MGLDNDDIKALIAILQKGLESDGTPSKKTNKSKPKQKTKKESRVNRFESMPENSMHKEDVAIDKKLTQSLSPTPRRDSFVPISAVCRVCHRTEMVDPSIIESIDRYKCNKCSISAG